jgi:acyl-CoA synthetase (NDP forming)
VVQLLDCYGLPLIPTRVVPDADSAAATAEEFGSPVALKAIAEDLVHKTDAGGVLLGLDGADAVRDAANEIERSVARAGHRLDGLVVQPMAPTGVELIVGVVHDQSFGPVLACGAGGTTAELISDVAVRITPVTDVQAREMLHSLKTFPLLDGYRGAPRCDIAAVEDVLLRVSAMVEAHPEIVELDCNPLIARPDGCDRRRSSSGRDGCAATPDALAQDLEVASNATNQEMRFRCPYVSLSTDLAAWDGPRCARPTRGMPTSRSSRSTTS